MLNLYPITEDLIKSLAGKRSVFVDPHDQFDPEGSDIVWIIKYSDGGMCEGEYLALSPSTPESTEWHAAHNAADVCGGHLTYWSSSGRKEVLLPVITKYFMDRANTLK